MQPPDKTSSGEPSLSPQVSITPQEEAEQRQFSEKFAAAMAKGVELAAEAERLGVPLHRIVPVS